MKLYIIVNADNNSVAYTEGFKTWEAAHEIAEQMCEDAEEPNKYYVDWLTVNDD